MGRAQTHLRDVNESDARLWHPWLRINRVLRVMLHTRWSAEAWPSSRDHPVHMRCVWAHSGIAKHLGAELPRVGHYQLTYWVTLYPRSLRQATNM